MVFCLWGKNDLSAIPHILFRLSCVYERCNSNVVEALGKGIRATGGQLKT